MSKIVENIKNEKLKSIVIAISIVVFIVGLIMTITNTGDTYAVENDGYYCHLGGGTPTYGTISEGQSGYFCSIEKVEIATTNFAVGNDLSDDSKCVKYLEEAGYLNVTTGVGSYCTYVAIPGPFNVYIKYSTNGGTLTTSTTTSSGVTNSWTVDAFSIINKNGSVYQTIINHIGKTGVDGLINYNNEKYINISKFGHNVPSGNEWICLSGCTTSGKTFSQTSQYNASDFCDATTSDCTVTLGVNWQPNKYWVSYNANKGNNAPEKEAREYNVWFKLSTDEPTREGYTFLGWDESYTATTATYKPGDSYRIDQLSPVQLFAVWEANTYTIVYNKNADDAKGTTASSTHTYDEPKKLTENGFSRDGYSFQGWSTTKSGNVTYTNNASVSNLSSTDDATVTLYAIWKSNSSGEVDNPSTSTTYTIKYDANGGSGAPNEQTKKHGEALTLSTTEPTRTNYTFLGWSISPTAVTPEYEKGGSYTNDAGVTLYAVWRSNATGEVETPDTDKTYFIEYTLNNGKITGEPEKAVYGEVITINNPTKTVVLHGNDNKNSATISKDVSVEQEFDGWTSSTINESTAYHGDTAWTDGDTKVTDTTFKNLTSVDKGKVTMVANWKPVTVKLPTVTKEGYICNWNTKLDGKGKEYASGGEYTVASDSPATVNLYAECTVNPKTGDTLIAVAWVLAIGTIGYAVYYFRSKKTNI